MTSFRSSSKIRSSTLWQTRKPVSRLSVAFLILGCGAGCWDYPKANGTWSGTIQTQTVYVDDNKPCQAALFIADGSSMTPNLNGRGFLVDSSNRLIDPASFPEHKAIKVSGVAGVMLATDAKGEPVTIQRRVSIVENGLPESMIAVDAKDGTANPPQGNWAKEMPLVNVSSG
jgi:hypothetical protein